MGSQQVLSSDNKWGLSSKADTAPHYGILALVLTVARIETAIISLLRTQKGASDMMEVTSFGAQLMWQQRSMQSSMATLWYGV